MFVGVYMAMRCHLIWWFGDNFLVCSAEDTVFIKYVDTNGFIKDVDKMFELLDGMVEEIGEENVVQIVTNSAWLFYLWVKNW